MTGVQTCALPISGDKIPVGVAILYFVNSHEMKFTGWGSWPKNHDAFGPGDLVSASWIDYKEVVHDARWHVSKAGDVHAINDEAREFGPVSKQ